MEATIAALFEAREGPDGPAAFAALEELFRRAEVPVDWAYDVWDRLVSDLSSRDNRTRSFAAQLLARLALSDPEGRMLRDFEAVARVMRDDRFVTARHALQSIWRVGLAGPDRRALAIGALRARFLECGGEKNGALVRTDVIAALRELADAVGEEEVGPVVEELIAAEADEGARRRQRASWRGRRR